MNTKTKITKQDGEYRVQLFIDGVYQTEADYFTDDKEDAEHTANRMKENPTPTDKTDENAIREQQEYDQASKTKVFFKKSTTEGFENTLIAFFPDAKTNPDMILSYEHIGQHGEASIEFCRECKNATPDEYAELKNELEKICGYNLKILSGEYHV